MCLYSSWRRSLTIPQSEKENYAPDYMSQDDEYEYEDQAPSPLDRKSALDRSQQLPPSVKKTQWKAAKGDMDVTMDMSLDVPTQMEVDEEEEEEDLPPPRLVQQKQLSRAPSPIFEADVKRTRASSSQLQAKTKTKPQPAPTKTTRNTRSSKAQGPELTSEDSMPSDSSEPPPARGAGSKKKR